jgi:hypothetical protein
MRDALAGRHRPVDEVFGESEKWSDPAMRSSDHVARRTGFKQI